MNEPWGNDDESWWHQLDLEMQEREEEERIEACNKAVDEASFTTFYRNYEIEVWREQYLAHIRRKHNAV